MKRFCVFVAVCLLCVGATACADTFNFELQEGSFSENGGFGTLSGAGTGTLTAVPDASIPGAFDITDLSGTFTAVGGTPVPISLLPCATFSQSSPCSGHTLAYDNLLYPGYVSPVPPFATIVLDDPGLGLDVGGVATEIFASSGHSYSIIYEGEPVGAHGELGAEFAVTATPEPGSWLLLGSGLLGIAGLRRRIWS